VALTPAWATQGQIAFRPRRRGRRSGSRAALGEPGTVPPSGQALLWRVAISPPTLKGMSPRQPPEESRHTRPEDADRTGGDGQHGGTGGAPRVEGALPESAGVGSPEEGVEQETGPEEPGVVHQTVEKLKYIATRPQF